MATSAETLMTQAAALRRQQRMIEADTVIAKARALIPNDPLIAFLFAQSRFELGYAAAEHFSVAQRLWPTNPDVLRNHALALAAEGQYPKGEALLADALAANPGWLEGHRVLAGLRWTHGNGDIFDASFAAASKQQPSHTSLWMGWFSAVAQHRDWPRASAILDAAEAALGDGQATLPARAFVAAETGDDAARALLAQLDGRSDNFTALCRTRFHLPPR
ncbi:MAG: hypothetical protein HC788_02855 [Sphingopyxis sp.]|nr:hypothetical protein [Sphingopyxis sp.]